MRPRLSFQVRFIEKWRWQGTSHSASPNPGNPRVPSREDSGVEEPASWPELGAVFTLGSGLRVSALLRSECVPRPMTSHGLPGWWYRTSLSTEWGGGQGKGWGCRPAPG